MISEIITIGDELLIGQVIDTNSAWIAQQLNMLGIKVLRRTAVADDMQQIINALAEASSRSKIVLITGGLGPTKDDITKNALCKYFNTQLVINESVLEHVLNLLKIRGVQVNELNRKQAEVPANCQVIENKIGTAPCMWFEQNNVIFVSMAGVPFEMERIMLDGVLPRLKTLMQNHGQVIVHKTVMTHGIPESTLSQMLDSWEDNLPENIRLAYLPSPGMIRLRLSAFGNDEGALNQTIANEIESLSKIIPEDIFGYDNQNMEQVIGNLLLERNATLATAESCTGGYISHLITSVSGSSRYYKGSVIAYSNEIKKQLLMVSSDNLNKYGAVSEQVVEDMALGAKSVLGSDYAIAISGIAGPDGGTAEKPVGTVWIAVATPHSVLSQKFLFGDSRQRNIIRASISALNMLRLAILNS